MRKSTKRNTQCCPSGRKPKRGDALLPNTERQFSIPPNGFRRHLAQARHRRCPCFCSAGLLGSIGTAMALNSAPPVASQGQPAVVVPSGVQLWLSDLRCLHVADEVVPFGHGRRQRLPWLGGGLEERRRFERTRQVTCGPWERGLRVGLYIDIFLWQFVVSMILLLIMSYTGDAVSALMRRNLASMFHRRLLKPDKLWYRLSLYGSMDNID